MHAVNRAMRDATGPVTPPAHVLRTFKEPFRGGAKHRMSRSLRVTGWVKQQRRSRLPKETFVGRGLGAGLRSAISRGEEEEMEAGRAREILTLLADGIDPYTGEQFPIDSPYQHPDTVRALFMAIAALPKSSRPKGASRDGRAGQPWSEQEDERLRDDFGSGMSVADLARSHERTHGAIAARLVRLGLVAGREDARLGAASNAMPAQIDQ